jgi:hypothetical protein
VPVTIATLRRRWTDVPLSTGFALVAVFGLAPMLGWAAAGESWRIFGLLASVGVAPLVLRWPIVSTFGLYVMVLPFQNVAMFGTATVARYAGILAAGMLLVVGLSQRRLVRVPLVAFLWAGLVLWAALTVTWALNTDAALFRLGSAINLVGLLLVAVSFDISREEFDRICVMAVIGGVASALMGYLFGYGAFEAGGRSTLAVGGVVANPNGFASSLLLPLALAVAGFMRFRTTAAKVASLAAIAFLGLGVYISISRSALLALAVMIAVMLYRVVFIYR